MTFSMTQTTKVEMEEEVRYEWRLAWQVSLQDETPKLSAREIEDAERAEKEAQQRRVLT